VLLWLVATAFSSLVLAQNSGTVTVSAFAPTLSVAQTNYWSVLTRNATIQVSTQTAPDASPAIQFTMTADGSLYVEHTLVTTLDRGSFGAFGFWPQASTTAIGDFVYLVDRYGSRRWYTLNMQSMWGWQPQHYSTNAFVGQETNFDLSNIVAVRFAQS